MGRLLGGVASQPSPQTSAGAGSLRLAVESPIKSLDPAESFYLVEYGMTELLMRPLPDGTVTGWLAGSVGESIPGPENLDDRPQRRDPVPQRYPRQRHGRRRGAFKPEPPTTSGMSAMANPDYWQGKPAVAGLSLLFVPDADTRVAAIQAGEADVALGVPAEAAQTVGGDAVFVASDKTPHARALLPHVTAAPMDDLRVRQAVFLAIDYQSMARDVLGASYLPATGFYPPGIPFRKDNYVHDPVRAAALLDAAGWRVDGTAVPRTGYHWCCATSSRRVIRTPSPSVLACGTCCRRSTCASSCNP